MRSASDDIDLLAVWRAILAKWKMILGITLFAGIATALILSQMTPTYTAETGILVGGTESIFRRPTQSSNSAQERMRVDKEAVASQVAVLMSDDLASQVAKKLDLQRNPDFNGALRPVGFIKHFLIKFGVLNDPFAMTERERVLRAFKDGLKVFPVGASRAITVQYKHADNKTGAEAANALAEAYIAWQRNERLRQTQSASGWLDAQIKDLRRKVKDSEAAVEAFRSKSGLFAGTNNITLSAQQLSEMNTQLILAKARRTEAETRARLIKKLLIGNGNIETASDVMKSSLIQRLLEQKVQVQRRVAQLSATHLQSHPALKRLMAELQGIRRQIRLETRKIVKGLSNEAQIAGAREASIKSSLDRVKLATGGQSANTIKLRQLERDAKANRKILESYLSRYQDANTRRDLSSVTANATIYSRAFASSLPTFPKKLPITMLVMVLAAMLSLFGVVTQALIAGGSRSHDDGPKTAPEEGSNRAVHEAWEDNPFNSASEKLREVAEAAAPPTEAAARG